MKKTYTTAQGKQISMDSLRLANEEVIAVGNMKVDASGRTLGPGGELQTSRQQVVNEYYNLHTQTVSGTVQQQRPPQADVIQTPVASADPLIDEQDEFSNLPSTTVSK